MLAPLLQTNVVQDFIDFSLDWLSDRKYTLTVDVDMARWATAMANAPGIAGVNETFDPRWNRLTARNSFWLDIRSGSNTIAMSAARLFVTDDYLELKRSLRLWFDAPPPTKARLQLTVPRNFPTIRGNVGHEGGLWVHPDHRKRGLSVILPHLNRALAFRQWDLDWQTGLARAGIGACGIASWAYGFPHVVQCYEGLTPISSEIERLHITYMSRDELLAGLELGAVTRLLPDRHQQPVYEAIRVQKR
ncbi:MAG TPA: hypothetical protein VL403_09500 [Candidatus Kryptonia bacterium]|nr:hypothetical protein [Candidatus Kryptonia bacterium]